MVWNVCILIRFESNYFFCRRIIEIKKKDDEFLIIIFFNFELGFYFCYFFVSEREFRLINLYYFRYMLILYFI